MMRFRECIQIVACNAPSTKWIKCQFILKIDSPTQSELPDVRILIKNFFNGYLFKEANWFEILAQIFNS